MIRRGHRFAELKRDYTIAQVLLMQRAAAVNEQLEKVEQAEAVALGIAAAFNPKADLLKKSRAALGLKAAGPQTPNPDHPLPPWLAGLPVVRRKRHGR